ncbi:MAG: hypothetical protein M1828_006299 [Chrysothrix sp. TS-e1954]|nr:MAG: hypothetical protein M1828_006299 [Chrysothrix sp. TS-e1954]
MDVRHKTRTNQITGDGTSQNDLIELNTLIGFGLTIFQRLHTFRRAAVRAISTSPTTSLSRTLPRRPLHTIQRLGSLSRPSLKPFWSQTRCYAVEPNDRPADEAQREEAPVEDVAAEVQAQDEGSVADPSEAAEGASGRSISGGERTNIQSDAAENVKDPTAVGFDSVDTASNTGTSGRPGPDRPVEPGDTVYIGNLYFGTESEQLNEAFGQFGTIVKSTVVKDQRGLSKGFGYVTFESTQEAKAACDAMNLKTLEGRRMVVNFAIKKHSSTERYGSRETHSPRNPPTKTVFVGNMSWEMSDDDLNNLFRPIKNVTDVRVAVDRRTGQPRGFAHADFTDVSSAIKAQETLQGKEVHGRTLRVDYAQNKPSRSAEAPGEATSQ